MFDIGGVELMVVAAIAILVVGPRELPGMLRAIGRFVRQARQMTSTVQRQFNDALKEAELDDVKKTIDDVRSLNPATQIRKTIAKEMSPLTDVGDSLKSSVDDAASIGKVDTGPRGTPDEQAAKKAASQKAVQTEQTSKPKAAAKTRQAAPSKTGDKPTSTLTSVAAKKAAAPATEKATDG